MSKQLASKHFSALDVDFFVPIFDFLDKISIIFFKAGPKTVGLFPTSPRKVGKLLRDNQEKLDPSEAAGLAVGT